MSRMLWILAVLLSHWRRHPMQLATLLIGLISATALVERRAGAEPAGAQQLRPRGRDVRRRANADAGRPQRRDVLAATLCRSAPRRLAGVARARRPPSDRRALVPAARHRAGHAARRKSAMRRRSDGRACKSFLTPPGETLVAPEMLSDLNLPEGASPRGKRRRVAAAAARAGATGAGCAGGRYRHRAAASQNAGSDFPAVDRQGQGQARAARKRRRRPSSAWSSPDAESDLERLTDSFHLNLTAFGLLSFFVGLFIVNSAIGLAFEQRLPMLRTLRACGVSARMLNTVLVIELVSLALVAGLVGSGLRLFDRSVAAARCRRLACADSMARKFPAS